MDRIIQISGKKLAALRNSRYQTQAELAQTLGISAGRISGMEVKDQIGMYAKNFRRLAEAYTMTPDALRDKIGIDAPAPDPSDNNVVPYSETIAYETPLFVLPIAAGGWVHLDDGDGGLEDRPGVVAGDAIARGLFRVRLRGDSMQPDYADDAIVEFQCLRADRAGPVVGEDYYVQLSDGRATFKRLAAMTDDDYEFRAINKRKYPKPMPISRGLVIRMALAMGTFTPRVR